MSIVIPKVKKDKMSLDNNFFAKLESSFPGAARGNWYVYAAAVFQANDRMDLVAKTWSYVKAGTFKEEDLLVKARKLREALLKASVLVGFPKVCVCVCVYVAQTKKQMHDNIWFC